MVPKPDKPRASAERKPKKKTGLDPEVKPVNAIFVRNRGGTAVTLSRCHYVSDLGGAGFRFEPQPGASPRGDHLPKRPEPGEDAILLHDLAPMRAFLNQVLRDHEIDAALFEVVLTLGIGLEVVAAPAMRDRADMSEEDVTAEGTRLTRQEIAPHPTFDPRVRSSEHGGAGEYEILEARL